MRKKRVKALKKKFEQVVGRVPNKTRVTSVDKDLVTYYPSEVRRLKKAYKGE